MKKLLSLLLVLFMLSGYALAAPQTVDLSVMPLPDLQVLQTELNARLALLSEDSMPEDDVVSVYDYAVPQTIDLDEMPAAELWVLQAKIDVRMSELFDVLPSVGEQSNDIKHVLNIRTKKFHRPDCKSVNQMNDENRKNTADHYDAVVAQGYDPCKNCDPAQ